MRECSPWNITLQALPHLTKADFSHSKLPCGFFEHFSGTQVTKSLKQIDLTGACGVGDGIGSLARLNLEDLSLKLCKDINIDSLMKLSGLQTLRSLNMEKCNALTPATAESIVTLPRLERLIAAQCEYLKNGVECLLYGAPTCLIELDLSCSAFLSNRTVDPRAWKELGRLQNLRVLRVSGRLSLAPSGNEELSFLRTMPQLESLDLGLCEDLTDQNLASLRYLTCLRRLTLDWCSLLTDDSTHSIASVRGLTFLGLSRCNGFTDMGLRFLFTNLRSLRVLEAHCTHMGDDASTALASLNQLQKLDICWCHQVTDIGISWISQAPTLSHLDINGCHQLTDASVKALTRAKLVHLDLHGLNQLTDAVVQHIAKMKTLKFVNLSWCRNISADAIVFLESHLKVCHVINQEALAEAHERKKQRESCLSPDNESPYQCSNYEYSSIKTSTVQVGDSPIEQFPFA